MNLYDIVEVIADREEYKNQGIVKGMRGRVIDIIREKPGWRAIYFINPQTLQKLTTCYIAESDLKNVDVLTDLNGNRIILPVKEYARVQVIVEKKKYADEGVHKGMVGWICDPRTIDGMRLVDFDQYGELPDIAIIPIKIKDFEVVTAVPECDISEK